MDLSQYKPKFRDGAYFAFGFLTDRFVMPKIQGYVSGKIKETIRSSLEESYTQQKAERDELYKKIDALSRKLDDMEKKVGT